MRKNLLKICEDISFPIDAVTQKFSFLGRTGSGKTYAAMKLAELMLEAGAQIIVIDPVGKWYGLRLAGNGPGFEIPVFGGLQGDIPLEPKAGALIADLVVNRGISVVLDTSQMSSGEQTKFVTDFGVQFFQRKKADSSAVHIFIEECQEFVPQNPNTRGGEEPKMLHAYERIVKLGRNFGIGVSLISQRPQEVNKKALNQTECMFAFQMNGPQERDAMVAWMGTRSDKSTAIEINDSLPKLLDHDCIIWSPSWLRIKQTSRVLPKRTKDVSSTPMVGSKTKKAEKLTPIDLKLLHEEMAETVQKSNDENPKLLRAKIAELTKQVAAKVPAPAPARVEIKEVPIVPAKELDRMMKSIDKYTEALVAACEKTCGVVRDANLKIEALKGRLKAPVVNVITLPQTSTVTVPRPKSTVVDVVKTRAHATPEPDDGDIKVGKGERDVLIAIVERGERGATGPQIALAVDLKKSSRDAYIARLRKKDLVTGDDPFYATASGVEFIGTDYTPLPSGADKRERWLEKLPPGEAAILKIAIERYPKLVNRDDLAALTPYTSSSIGAYVGRLQQRELLASGRGDIQASETLFDG